MHRFTQRWAFSFGEGLLVASTHRFVVNAAVGVGTVRVAAGALFWWKKAVAKSALALGVGAVAVNTEQKKT